MPLFKVDSIDNSLRCVGCVWASSLMDGGRKRARASIVRPVLFFHVVVCTKIIYFQEKFMFDAC